ncbi:MAG: hypothetical protein ACJ71Q_14610 [Terriglobales bacterium]|jgi:hypothetical protein
MAYRYHIDPDSKTVLISFSGHSSMDEAISLRHELRADPLFRSTLNELVDLGRLSSSDGSFDDFAMRGAQGDPFCRESRRAIVAPTEFSYGMARMYAALRDRDGVFGVFRSLETACKWLDLDESAVSGLLQQ